MSRPSNCHGIAGEIPAPRSTWFSATRDGSPDSAAIQVSSASSDRWSSEAVDSSWPCGTTSTSGSWHR
ncbi:MAG TPA: hypothetical protein VE172_15320 [Stackebrandtia sp.]|nr:hypothetical protein [Stackebrandtia sp.]HZE40175.1 hypothetical protein [Stackebrandtia sp.]